MMLKQKKVKRVGTVMILVIMVILLTYFFVGSRLVYQHPVDSRNILLEGWMVQNIINEAPEYLLDPQVDSIIIITMDDTVDDKGAERIRKVDKNRNKYTLVSNGALAIDIPLKALNERSFISFKMRGSLNSNITAHYTVFFNQTLLHHGFATKEDSIYHYTIYPEQIDTINQLLIYFNNDAYTPDEDRNLYISSVFVDSVAIGEVADEISISYQYPYTNHAGLKGQDVQKYLLVDTGTDTSKIHWVNIDATQVNKSIAFARGAQAYFGSSTMESINLITREKHSRRSFLNFRACLNEDIKLGCIALPSSYESSLFNELDERVSLMYTWGYWVFN